MRAASTRLPPAPTSSPALAALLGVLVFDTLPGLFIGIAVSLLLLLYRASRPHVALLGRAPGDGQWSDVERHPENTTEPGIVVLRPESGLFFANAYAIRDAIRAQVADGTRAIVLDAETVPSIDVTAVDMLVASARDLRRDGIKLVLATSAPSATSSRRAAERTSRRTRPYEPPSPPSATSSARPRTPREVLRVDVDAAPRDADGLQTLRACCSSRRPGPRGRITDPHDRGLPQRVALRAPTVRVPRQQRRRVR